MKMIKIKRRLFESIIGLIWFSLTIGLSFVFVQIARFGYGYSSWFVLLLFPALLLVLGIVIAAYAIYMPYIIYRIMQYLFHLQDDKENVDIWFVALNVIAWLGVIPIVIAIGYCVPTLYAQ